MLWGPINTALAVVPRMRERGRGHIGVITSLGGLISAPHLLPYSTAKFGAVGFARGLRSELSGTGVTVTTVAPGLMRTGSHLRAKFVGNQGREFAWFGTAASLPAAVDGRGAGRRPDGPGDPAGTVGPDHHAAGPDRPAGRRPVSPRDLGPARPDRPTAAQSPGRGSDGATIEGWQAAKKLPAATRMVVDQLSRLGRTAARRFNEEPTP